MLQKNHSSQSGSRDYANPAGPLDGAVPGRNRRVGKNPMFPPRQQGAIPYRRIDLESSDAFGYDPERVGNGFAHVLLEGLEVRISML
jgi:hypothetical protein